MHIMVDSLIVVESEGFFRVTEASSLYEIEAYN